MIKVLIADDHRMFREGLRTLLGRTHDVEVVAEANDGCEAVALTRERQPDLVLMDFAMEGMNGLEATVQIRRECPAVRVIMLSMYSDRRFVTSSLRAGASGYILKDAGFDELLSAIPRVAQGQIVLGRALVDSIVQDYVQLVSREDEGAFQVLSPREREVLQLLAEGHSTQEIALRLRVSPKTIETHRKQVMDKLGLRSVAELTKYAIREGLTSLE